MAPGEDPNRTVPRNASDSPPAADDTKPRVADDSSAGPNRTADRGPTPAADGTVARTPSDIARLEESAQTLAAEAIPGYVFLRELGRGGMGVVHQARHLKLNRVVALKLMLADLATEKDRIRFLAEAESVAAVKHENVVQVYDYGESEGRPFMALEFCPGGTLSRLLPQGSDAAKDPRGMASLVAKVARGVAAAHALGIVHRDLKPGNVFLDDVGMPKVADFGLAKRGEGADVTQAGQGMGTPSYMAPEQAKDAKFVGPQADVWALGVILYEALTGTRPFTGTVHEILAQAEKTDPLPPRKVVPAVPRDLELICLHCLAKAPHERYPTAAELAADLDRYARNEPISVRPAGPLERGYKWVRRNKVVSGAAVAVFLALSIGTGVSLAFGLDARQQAEEAEAAAGRERDAARRAEAAADRERTAKELAEQRRQEAVSKQRLANRRLATTFLGPFVTTSRYYQLTPHERDALWGLAESRADDVAWIFLEEAVRDRYGSGQLANRAELALHAAIGLDARRRDEFDRLLLTRTRTAGGEHAVRLAQAFARWDRPSPTLAAEVARILAAALARDTDLNRGETIFDMGLDSRQTLAWDLATVSLNLEPNAAVAVLSVAILRERNLLAIQALAKGLTEVVAHADGATAEATAHALAEVVHRMAEQKNFDNPSVYLVQAACAAAERTGPERAARFLTAALARGARPEARRAFAMSLSRVATKLDPSAAVETIACTLEHEPDASARMHLAWGLSWAATRSPRAAAARVPAALDAESTPLARLALARALAAAAGGLTPSEAEGVCSPRARALADAVVKETFPESRRTLAEALAALAEYLPATAAAEICTPAAQAIIAALDKEHNASNRAVLSAGMRALVAYRNGADLTRLSRAIPIALTKEPSPLARQVLAEALAVLVTRLEPEEATALCAAAADALSTGLERETTAAGRQGLATGLAAVAPRLGPDAARRSAAAVDLLATALAKEATTGAAYELAGGITAVAAHLDPDAAARVADLLFGLSRKRPDHPARSAAVSALAAVAARMRPADAAKIAVLASAETDPATRWWLASLMPVAAAGLDPTSAADLLTRAMSNEVSLNERVRWAEELTRARWMTAIALGAAPQDIAWARGAPPLAAGAFAAPHNVLPSLPLLHSPTRPRPLPPQALVELLKHPFCVGETRRAVLDALQFTYNRPFKDQWEFVEYAQKHQPHLDLLTPPKRPEAKP